MEYCGEIYQDVTNSHERTPEIIVRADVLGSCNSNTTSEKREETGL